ncbi:hypothetical protein [Micromonospora sp. NPDC005203]
MPPIPPQPPTLRHRPEKEPDGTDMRRKAYAEHGPTGLRPPRERHEKKV